MPWLVLTLAILFEIAGTTFMKLSNGFQALIPSLMVFACYAVSFSLMILALKGIDLGVAYAVWAGVGTAMIALIGVVIFGEVMTPLKLASLALVVIGVVGLKLSG